MLGRFCVASYSAIASFENSVFFSLAYIFLVCISLFQAKTDEHLEFSGQFQNSGNLRKKMNEF